MDQKTIEKAFGVAKEARSRAYAPYSKFLVGAALVTQDGEMIPGCNVENASYGATICAERTAFFSAVAQGKRKFAGIVLVTEPQAVPCGECLQVMSEFFSAETPVILCDTQKIKKEFTFGELLPQRFDSDVLS
jgi:cytidine deaminase